MDSTLTVAEAARLIGRSTDAVRKLIERYGVEKQRDANGHTFRVRATEIMRAAKRSKR